MSFDLDPVNILKSVGYLGMLISVLLENGVIFLFFMPSDSLLFAAGLLTAMGYFDLWTTILVCFIGSVLGYMLGYAIGYKAGPAVFKEENEKYMTQKHLEHAKNFYNKYASFALVLARFFPVRAFVTTMAGASHVDYPTFMLYNVIGGAIWTVGLVLAGHFFGQLFTPEEMHFVFGGLLVCFLGVVVLMPLGAKWLKKKHDEHHESLKESEEE
ncbi:MAG: DedA family protein [Alphaproteobacteria bacterium]|nr:DedA family protein [Alphaproteobacteria bacterium]